MNVLRKNCRHVDREGGKWESSAGLSVCTWVWGQLQSIDKGRWWARRRRNSGGAYGPHQGHCRSTNWEVRCNKKIFQNCFNVGKIKKHSGPLIQLNTQGYEASQGKFLWVCPRHLVSETAQSGDIWAPHPLAHLWGSLCCTRCCLSTCLSSHILRRPVLAPQDVSWLRIWYFLSWVSFWLLFWLLLSSLVAKYLCEIKSLVHSLPTVYILQYRHVSGHHPCALETSVNLV